MYVQCNDIPGKPFIGFEILQISMERGPRFDALIGMKGGPVLSNR